MNKVILLLLLASSTAALAEECDQGARAAYEAYLMTTYDAKQPDKNRLAAALDYRLSQQPFAADETHAYKALDYIVKRMKDAGVRTVHDYEVAAVVGEYVTKECL